MPLPFFGFSFLISIAIIVVSFFLRLVHLGMPAQPAEVQVYPRQRTTHVVTSLLIILTIFAVSMSVYFKITHVASSDHHNNVNLATHYVSECAPIPEPLLHDRMVVLRLDDVQAHSWSSVNIRMMEDALVRHMPIVAGVIPKGIEDDFRMMSFLMKENCNIEIAIHGYTHGIGGEYSATYGEFYGLSKAEAEVRLRAALDEVRPLTSMPIVTFIPPQNQISAEAHSVLSEFGITHLSSEGKGVYDYDASTWNNVPALEVAHECEKRFDAGDKLCVIMLHPQEFSNKELQVDEEKYREYTKLLDLLETMQVSVVRFNDVTPEMLN